MPSLSPLFYPLITPYFSHSRVAEGQWNGEVPLNCSFTDTITAYCKYHVDPSDLMVSILATGSEVHGFKTGRGRWIFLQSVKILLSMTFFGREVKPWVRCPTFMAHKRTSCQN